MRNVILTIGLISISFFSNAQDSTKVDSTKSKLLELSFGQSLLFISDSKVNDIHAEEAVVIPTSNILFFAEFRPLKKFRLPIYANIPTESKQFIVDSVLVNEKANPDFGLGFQYLISNINIDSKTQVQFEAGALANFIFPKNSKTRLSPVLAGRVRFIKQKDFVMYIGPTYAIGIQTWGLIFGTGYIF